jgi:hypothetical protein
MCYLVRLSTKIPVPKVLDWSDDSSNSIGSEYIIMEHVPGVQLHGKWSSMNPHQHMLCVKNVSFLVVEMSKLKFPAYGSLYFADALIDDKSKIDISEGFCIGPHYGTQYSDCNVEEQRLYDKKPPNRGPCTSIRPCHGFCNSFVADNLLLGADVQAYCSGLTDNGLSRIPKTTPVQQLPYRGTIQEHLNLLSISRRVIERLIKSSLILQVADPILMHPDIYKRNIFVSEEDPSCVTAIIDWQSTCIEPTFVHASETPDFADDPATDNTNPGKADVFRRGHCCGYYSSD